MIKTTNTGISQMMMAGAYLFLYNNIPSVCFKKDLSLSSHRKSSKVIPNINLKNFIEDH
jgi:hypothetical protein